MLLLQLILQTTHAPSKKASWRLTSTLPLSVSPNISFPGGLVPGKAGEQPATLLQDAFVSLVLKQLRVS